MEKRSSLVKVQGRGRGGILLHMLNITLSSTEALNMHQLLKTSPRYTLNPSVPGHCEACSSCTEQLQKHISSTTLLLVSWEQRLGSQFLLPVSMQSLLAPEHHGGEEESRHTAIQKDEENRNQVLEEEVAIRKQEVVQGGTDRKEGEAQGEGLTAELEQMGMAGSTVNRPQPKQQDGERRDYPMYQVLSCTSLCSQTLKTQSRTWLYSPVCSTERSYPSPTTP